MSQKKILIVDDEPDILESIRFQLEQDGHEVFSAVNGWEALGAIRAIEPDLVILDVMMPKENGYRVSKMIKEDVASARIAKKTPIILLTGPGLLKADQERVFDRFYQVGDALGQSIPGTGLGLAISKELVGLQGGEISVESEPGQGCRFFFTLPVYSQEAIEMAALEERIRAYPKDSLFSLFVVRPPLAPFSPDKGEAAFVSKSRDKRLELERLHQISTFIQKVLRRDSDQTHHQSAFGRVVCLLPETHKIGALRVVERLQALLGQEGLLSPGEQIAAFSLPVLYPADGSTGKALISKSEC